MKRNLMVLAVVLTCLATMTAFAGPFDENVPIKIPSVTTANPDAVVVPPPPVDVPAANPNAAKPKADEPKAPAAAAPTKQEDKTYKVAKGDTLWAIAQKVLGDGSRYPEIIKANSEKYPSLLKNPNLILVDWVLVLPGSATPQAPKPGDKPADKPGEKPGEKPADKPKVPELSVAEKVAKLQAAITALNLQLLPQGLTVTQLNEATVRMMIDRGIITEEQWMALNPPVGYRWVIKVGKVTLVDAQGNAVSPQAVDKEQKDKAAQDKEAQAKADAAKKAAADKAAADKAAADKAAADKAAATQSAAEKAAAEKAAADKAAKDKADAEKKAKEAADAKAKEEAAKSRAQRNYENDLKNIGMPDLTKIKETDLANALSKAERLNGKLGYFIPYYAQYSLNIHLLQLQLLDAEKLYEQKVNENDTSKFLGIFGNTIETAGKKVEELKKTLSEAWGKFKAEYGTAKAKAAEAQSAKTSIETEKKAIEAQLAKIDRYNSANASEVQRLLKDIEKKADEIKDRQKDIDSFQPLKQMFGM